MEKLHAPSTEKNREPILTVLRDVFADRQHVLEIGSGTGQHAIHFCQHLPHLTWQPSDRSDFLPGIHAWLEEAALPNILPPLEFDLLGPWPLGVRPRGRAICGVEVPAGVGHNSVAEGNCVVVRRGGE